MKLISSDVLLFEIGRTPDQNRKEDALAILKIAKESVEILNTKVVSPTELVMDVQRQL